MRVPIGRNIKAERERLGWEQDDLAANLANQDVQMTGRTLGKIERGEREVRGEELRALSVTLGVPSDALINGPEWISAAKMAPRLAAILASGNDDIPGYPFLPSSHQIFDARLPAVA